MKTLKIAAIGTEHRHIFGQLKVCLILVVNVLDGGMMVIIK